MSDPGSELSFDRAEYTEADGTTPCASCRSGLRGQYWTYQTQPLCGACKSNLAASFLAAGKGRFGKALMLGGLTSLGCGIAYATFVALTDYQLALITIGIAFVIAQVVRKASGGVGGLRFQLLAVALTYFASAMGYFPAVWHSVMSDEPASEAAEGGVPEPSGTDVKAAPAAAESAANTDASHATESSASTLALGALFFVLVTLAAPVMAIGEAPLGFLIVLFGLWEAWRLTRPVSTTIEGPFRAADAPQPEAA